MTCPCGHDWTEHGVGGCTFLGCGCSRPRTTTATDMVTWTCYQWPRECGHHDDVDCMATADSIRQRLQTFEVPDA